MRKMLILQTIFFGMIVLLTYGYTLHLSFWRDDYALIYRIQQGGLFPWPYQGWSISYYPIYFLFHEDPIGYFGSALILYVILCTTTSLFMWKFTNDKVLGFMAGLFFSFGYVGADIMFMSSVSASSISYIILSMLLLLLYNKYVANKSLALYVLVLAIYGTLTFLFGQRAHSLLYLVFLSRLYYETLFQFKFKKVFVYLFKVGFMTLPFFFVSLLINGNNSSGLLNSVTHYFKIVNFNVLTILFANFSGFLFPTGNMSLKKAIFSGILLVIFLLVYFIKGKMKSEQKALGFFLISLCFFGYINYHMSAWDTFHEATQRYLLFGYPFFAMVLALIFRTAFFLNKRILLRRTGVILVFVFGLFHIHQTHLFGELMLERNVATKNFFIQLRETVPNIKGPTLFYFDIVADTPTWVRFGDLMRVGIYQTEVALASFYKVNVEDIKIVDTFKDYISEKNGGRYTNSYSFFYNIHSDLIATDLSRKVISEVVKVDLKKGGWYEKYAQDPFLDLTSSTIHYKSLFVSTNNGTKSLNGMLKFLTSKIVSDKPLKIVVDVRMRDLVSDIPKFPYVENGISDMSKSLPLEEVHNKKQREELLNYIRNKEAFRNSVKVTSTSFGAGREASNIIDGKLDTSWEVDKREWVRNKETAINIELPQVQEISQVRFISPNMSRLPVSYGYQVKVKETEEWRSIFRINNALHQSGVYVVDNFPTINAKYFRMIIYDTYTHDFPGISEIQVLKSNVSASSPLADFIERHPLASVLDLVEAQELIEGLGNNLTVDVYPLSDKYLRLDESAKITIPVVIDDKDRLYEAVIPPGGTALEGFVLKFPNIPVELTINAITIFSN